MIRQLFISLLFFFGPALLVVVIRHLVILLHLAIRSGRHQHDPEIIDITPTSPGRPPRWFLLAAILIGFFCAWFAWWSLANPPEPSTHYVPAYTDSNGQVIPGKVVTH
ncbi:MAG: hypothetical protein Q9M26_06945 [Mariprofundales bacterium]|nr:hypothetical protein [Mariprofundales bacterium]